MLNRSERIADSSLRRLHPDAIEHPGEILELLGEAHRSGARFHRALNAEIDLEIATLERIEGDRLLLRAQNFEDRSNPQVFLNFSVAGRPYFFSTRCVGRRSPGELSVRIPETVFAAERRDRIRQPPDPEAGDPRRVLVDLGGGKRVEGEVADLSPGGMAVRVHGRALTSGKHPVTLRFLDGREAGAEERMRLRRRDPLIHRNGWTRLGLVRNGGGSGERIAVEQRSAILESSMGRVARRPVDWQVPAATPDAGAEEPLVVRYANRRGEELVGLVDSWGDPRGAIAVLIPTGWGQTKEVLLPLARTIVATFRAAGRPVCVLRFDGIRRRGESHNDPECQVPGREHHHFTFSQGVEDIEASLDFLSSSPQLQPAKTILVTFSAAAIAGRRAVARDEGKRLAGWLSVVGSPDIQSMTRSISGGVDFAAGYEQGMRFGLQELLGVVVDIDRIGDDSAAEQMIFLEDARRDMTRVRIPVTWYHGQYDAWMDLERVRDVLSQGDTRDRRLVTIPTGHQVKSSRQALETFQCAAIEIGRMALGEELPATAPGSGELRRRRLAERRRRPAAETDLRAFWRDYLVGRDRSVGIELMTSASPYRALMQTQIRNLALYPGDRVADLGSGTGSFVRELARGAETPGALVIDQFDYVREAHERARQRAPQEPRAGGGLGVSYTLCDLDLRHEAQRLPVRSGSYDAAIGSLVLSYLENPLLLLREMYRILRPGGRLVVSSMCRDADISKLYVESLAELQEGQSQALLPGLDRGGLETAARSFLNDAARILDLEESGAFRFWDAEELEALVAEAGFRAIVSDRGFGDPPQAVVVSARRA